MNTYPYSMETTMTVQSKFQQAYREINAGMIERDEEINLVMVALLSGEHVILVSEPGQGKSMLADAIVDMFLLPDPAFKYILNRYTEPAEILGPIDIPGLKAGDHRHITKGKLPEAAIAFIDETFKGSSAILNVLLRILNERKFQNGLTDMACPLLTCIGASNEWGTEAKELGALFDRFLFRKEMRAISTESNIDRLMFGNDVGINLTQKVSLDELKGAQVEIRQNVLWSPEAKEAAHTIRRKLAAQGIQIGDRRLRKSSLACSAQSWLHGNPCVTTDDLEILAHMWWSDPVSHPQTVAEIVTEVAAPSGMIAATALAQCNEITRGLDMTNLSESIAAIEKLTEIATQIKKHSGPRVDEVLLRIREASQGIREANMSATGM